MLINHLCTYFQCGKKIPWRRKWQPPPVFLLGEFHGQRSHGVFHFFLFFGNRIFVYQYIGEGTGNPLQYSCLENPMDGGAWWAAVHEVAKSWTWPRDFTFTFHFHALEKEMATHSSVLAWRIPGTGEPGGLPSMGLHRVGHDWCDLAAAAYHYIVGDLTVWWVRGTQKELLDEVLSYLSFKGYVEV